MSTTNVLQNTTLHIKLQFNDDYRRFNVTRTCSFLELVEKVQTILTLKDKEITLKYKDDENEWITISSDVELETGLTFAKDSLLRLMVSVKSIHSKCCPTKGMMTGDEGENVVPHWKRRRNAKWREMKENEIDCKKWRKRRDSEESGSDGEGKKWRKRGNRRGENEEGEKRRSRKFSDEEREEWREMRRKKRMEKKEMRKERRYKKEEEEEEKSDEKTEEKSEKKDDTFSGDELLSLEQIKNEIEVLKNAVGKLREKNKVSQESLSAIRVQIKEKRRAGATDEVLSLREVLKTKVNEKKAVLIELKKIQKRIKTLQKLATSKGN